MAFHEILSMAVASDSHSLARKTAKRILDGMMESGELVADSTSLATVTYLGKTDVSIVMLPGKSDAERAKMIEAYVLDLTYKIQMTFIESGA